MLLSRVSRRAVRHTILIHQLMRTSNNVAEEAAQSVRNSVGSSGVGESHATGQSYVPKPVQKAAPGVVEDVLPNAVHDTSGRAGTAANKSGAEISGQAKGAANEYAGEAKGKAAQAGMDQSHATGQSYVPESVQKVAPEAVEDALPNAVHDTSGRSGTAANQSGSEIAGQAKGKANELAGQAKGKASEVQGKMS